MKKRTMMMLLLLLTAAVPRAFAESRQIPELPQGPAVEQWLVSDASRGPGGGYWGSTTRASTPFSKRRSEIGAQAKVFRSHPVTAAEPEYSAFFSRELYHVKAVGRLGTSPPNAERHGYHVAQGEAVFTFYGAALGPEHPGLGALVWESSGPVPATLDRTWVTTFHVTYTNTAHHLAPKVIGVPQPGLPPKIVSSPADFLVVAQNTWQFELRETYKERTSLALELGGNRYNKLIPDGSPRVFLNNVQYIGNAFAVDGWPNNHVSGLASQIVGDWKAWAGATHLNLLDNELNLMYGGGLDWRPGRHWTLTSGYYYNRRRRTSTRRGISLGVSYAW